jgi:uncharacterized protein YllA (UPF0747 family)
MNRQLTPSQSVHTHVRRELLACMETGNIDRARTVLAEYKSAAKESHTLVDLSEDLIADIVATYGVVL